MAVQKSSTFVEVSGALKHIIPSSLTQMILEFSNCYKGFLSKQFGSRKKNKLLGRSAPKSHDATFQKILN